MTSEPCEHRDHAFEELDATGVFESAISFITSIVSNAAAASIADPRAIACRSVSDVLSGTRFHCGLLVYVNVQGGVDADVHVNVDAN